MLVTRAVQVGAAARAAALNGSPEDSLRGKGAARGAHQMPNPRSGALYLEWASDSPEGI